MSSPAAPAPTAITSNQPILITGATGATGGAVARTMKQQRPDTQLHLLVRDPSKCAQLHEYGTLVQGDLSNAASLQSAMSGMYSVFLVIPVDAPGAGQLTDIAIKAAKAADVKFIVLVG